MDNIFGYKTPSKYLQGRAILKGKKLSLACRKATCSGVVYEKDGVKYYGCCGIYDMSLGDYTKECYSCGAFVNNINVNE